MVMSQGIEATSLPRENAPHAGQPRVLLLQLPLRDMSVAQVRFGSFSWTCAQIEGTQFGQVLLLVICLFCVACGCFRIPRPTERVGTRVGAGAMRRTFRLRISPSCTLRWSDSDPQRRAKAMSRSVLAIVRDSLRPCAVFLGLSLCRSAARPHKAMRSAISVAPSPLGIKASEAQSRAASRIR